MSFKGIANNPTLVATSTGNFLAALDDTFFEEVFQVLGKKKFVEPLKKQVTAGEEIGEMNEFEKAMYTVFASYEGDENKRKRRWSEIALMLLEENIEDRYGPELETRGKIFQLNFHRDFKITAICETEAESLAQ